VEGTIEVLPEYREGLKDIDGFSHLILIYHLHLSKRAALEVIPFLDDKPHGIFATRSPKRPNPIGFSVVWLLKVEGCRLFIAGVNMVDGTPVLDIKPYVPEFEAYRADRIGWFTTKASFNH